MYAFSPSYRVFQLQVEGMLKANCDNNTATFSYLWFPPLAAFHELAGPGAKLSKVRSDPTICAIGI